MEASSSLFNSYMGGLSYSPLDNRFLVTAIEERIPGEYAVVGFEVEGDGMPIGSTTVPLSKTYAAAQAPSRSMSDFGAGANNYLVVWSAPEQPGPLEMITRDIRGQLYQADLLTTAPHGPGTQGAARISFAYPNPFSSRLQFAVDVDRTQDARVDVYNARGRRVARLFDGRLQGPASHAFSLSGRGLASGVFWIRVTGEGSERSKRVTLLR